MYYVHDIVRIMVDMVDIWLKCIHIDCGTHEKK